MDNINLIKNTPVEINKNYSGDLKVIKEALLECDIIAILESEYDLFFQSSSNGWFNTNCPLPEHDDSSPSFGVNAETGAFHCFGCGASGDLISFIRKMEGLTFKQALERISLIIGLDNNNDDNKTYRALKAIKEISNDFINYQPEYNLPGGISPVNFINMITEYVKKYQNQIELNYEDYVWIEQIYEKIDSLVMKEDFKSLNKFWKTIRENIKNRKSEGIKNVQES